MTIKYNTIKFDLNDSLVNFNKNYNTDLNGGQKSKPEVPGTTIEKDSVPTDSSIFHYSFPNPKLNCFKVTYTFPSLHLINTIISSYIFN